jgi:hypothetical protein
MAPTDSPAASWPGGGRTDLDFALEYPRLEAAQQERFDRRAIAIYTAGFPDPTLMDALVGIARRRPDMPFRHWGDSDLGGLRIWWLIRSRLGCPVPLYRTRAEWLESAAATDATQALDGGERAGLARLRGRADRDAPPPRQEGRAGAVVRGFALRPRA